MEIQSIIHLGGEQWLATYTIPPLSCCMGVIRKKIIVTSKEKPTETEILYEIANKNN